MNTGCEYGSERLTAPWNWGAEAEHYCGFNLWPLVEWDIRDQQEQIKSISSPLHPSSTHRSLSYHEIWPGTTRETHTFPSTRRISQLGSWLPNLALHILGNGLSKQGNRHTNIIEPSLREIDASEYVITMHEEPTKILFLYPSSGIHHASSLTEKICK